jgi:hypothetical protein
MDFATVLSRYSELGVLGLLCLVALVGYFRIWPQRQKQLVDRENRLFGLAEMFGTKIVEAQNKQADAVSKLSEALAKRDGASQRCMDDLQLALGGVAQHVNNLHGEVVHQSDELAAVKNALDEMRGGVDDKLNRLLAR